MQHLSPSQRAELVESLEAERARLSARQSSEEAEAEAEQELGDVQDKASEEMRRSNALRRLRHREGRLGEVQAAIQRMHDGVYGLCEETDEPIPFARLRAEPTTRYTVEALEMLEEERAREQVQTRHPDETDAY